MYLLIAPSYKILSSKRTQWKNPKTNPKKRKAIHMHTSKKTMMMTVTRELENLSKSRRKRLSWKTKTQGAACSKWKSTFKELTGYMKRMEWSSLTNWRLTMNWSLYTRPKQCKISWRTCGESVSLTSLGTSSWHSFVSTLWLSLSGSY